MKNKELVELLLKEDFEAFISIAFYDADLMDDVIKYPESIEKGEGWIEIKCDRNLDLRQPQVTFEDLSQQAYSNLLGL